MHIGKSTGMGRVPLALLAASTSLVACADTTTGLAQGESQEGALLEPIARRLALGAPWPGQQDPLSAADLVRVYEATTKDLVSIECDPTCVRTTQEDLAEASLTLAEDGTFICAGPDCLASQGTWEFTRAWFFPASVQLYNDQGFLAASLAAGREPNGAPKLVGGESLFYARAVVEYVGYQRTDVGGVEMAYLDVGEGPAILLLHGLPTQSYLWRDVIPHVAPHGRVVVPDIVGFGLSDAPEMEYKPQNIQPFVDQFIENLGLEDVLIVVHDWGGYFGFDYASRHEDNVRGLIGVETIFGPTTFAELEALNPEFAQFQRAARTPGVGEAMIIEQNFVVEGLLPSAVLAPPAEHAMQRYRAPFQTLESREKILTLVRSVPIDGEPSDVHASMSAWSDWLFQSSVPKLLLYAEPGFVGPPALIQGLAQSMSNATSASIGPGIHFVQEDAPAALGEAIGNFSDSLQ